MHLVTKSQCSRETKAQTAGHEEQVKAMIRVTCCNPAATHRRSPQESQLEKLNSGRIKWRGKFKCFIFAYKGTLHQTVGHNVSEKGP